MVLFFCQIVANQAQVVWHEGKHEKSYGGTGGSEKAWDGAVKVPVEENDYLDYDHFRYYPYHEDPVFNAAVAPITEEDEKLHSNDYEHGPVDMEVQFSFINESTFFGVSFFRFVEEECYAEPDGKKGEDPFEDKNVHIGVFVPLTDTLVKHCAVVVKLPHTVIALATVTYFWIPARVAGNTVTELVEAGVVMYFSVGSLLLCFFFGHLCFLKGVLVQIEFRFLHVFILIFLVWRPFDARVAWLNTQN